MDEEKKIIEKRSSFKGWKERNKGKTNNRKNVIVSIIAILIMSVLVAYPYLSNVDNSNISVGQQDNTSKLTPVKNTTTNYSKNKDNPTPKIINTPKATTTPKKIVTGDIGVPLVTNSLEITIKRANPSMLYTNIWTSVKNLDGNEKQFRIGSGTVVIDNMGQQYEAIKIARSSEISQANLSAYAMREGAIFFERLIDGRTLKKLILNANNEKIEFTLTK
jgi:hypothetical protein